MRFYSNTHTHTKRHTCCLDPVQGEHSVAKVLACAHSLPGSPSPVTPPARPAQHSLPVVQPASPLWTEGYSLLPEEGPCLATEVRFAALAPTGRERRQLIMLYMYKVIAMS